MILATRAFSDSANKRFIELLGFAVSIHPLSSWFEWVVIFFGREDTANGANASWGSPNSSDKRWSGKRRDSYDS